MASWQEYEDMEIPCSAYPARGGEFTKLIRDDAQTKAFEKLAKLKEKFPSYNKPRRLSEADSYMLRMADMDKDYMEGCDTAFESNMWGDFNGNESDFHSW